MDAIVNDQHQRLVVTYEQTAWGGICTAINEMEKRRNDFYSEVRAPFNITIFGMGNLGVNAGRLCFQYFNEKLTTHKQFKNINGVVVTYLEKTSTKSKNEIRTILSNTDLLIDATKRENFSEYILTNDLIGCLKDEAIILDLTADPYDVLSTPMQVKAFEGIPYGTLEKYIFDTDSTEYNLIPPTVCTDFRRVAVSCNAWPGVFPEKSMKIYGEQLLPFIDVLIKKNLLVSEESNDLNERAIYRASIGYFLKHQHNSI
jgi:alanine dehydrogenase